MNLVVLVGRITKDIELKQSQQGKAIGKTSIAVRRDYKNSEGKYDADFLNLIAFGNTAEFMSKYFEKGSMVAITGRIQTGSYNNKEGQKIYTTDVIVNTAEFVESKKTESKPEADTNGFTSADDLDLELPFA